MAALDLLSRVEQMQNEMDRLFSAFRPEPTPRSPAVNVWVSDDGGVVTAELPGIDPDKLDLSVHGNVLTLRGNRRLPELKEGEQWIRRERVGGDFIRTVELPFRVDTGKVEATYTKGVLMISLSRVPEEQPKRVEVKTAK